MLVTQKSVIQLPDVFPVNVEPLNKDVISVSTLTASFLVNLIVFEPGMIVLFKTKNSAHTPTAPFDLVLCWTDCPGCIRFFQGYCSFLL